MNTITLMYHCVYKDSPAESGFQNPGAERYKLPLSAFAQQLAALRPARTTQPGHPADIQFTFDDGGTSFLLHIAPLLEQHGIRGHFFIATRYIGTPGFLTSNQIRQLHRRGHTIGAHSHSHPADLSRLTPAQIHREWDESVHILTGVLGQPVHTASIPNGFSSRTVVREAARSGIRTLYTSEPTPKEQHIGTLTLRGRYAVQAGQTVAEIQAIVASPAARRRIHLRYHLLEAGKKLLGPGYLAVRAALLRKKNAR